jgi:hypothetical protein
MANALTPLPLPADTIEVFSDADLELFPDVNPHAAAMPAPAPEAGIWAGLADYARSLKTDFGSAVQRGAASDATADALQTLDANRIAANQAALRDPNLQPSPETQEIGQTKTMGQAVRAFMRDPLRVGIETGAESLSAFLPQTFKTVPERALVGAGAGAVGGAALGGVGAGPGALLGGTAGMIEGMGRVSYDLEMAGRVLGLLEQEHGVDPTNANALQAAFDNPELMRQVWDRASRGALATATFDAASAAVGGRMITQPAKSLMGKAAQAGAEIGVQGALGGAGSVAGSVAAGEQINPGDVMLEAVGEAFAPEILTGAATASAESAVRAGRANVAGAGKKPDIEVFPDEPDAATQPPNAKGPQAEPATATATAGAGAIIDQVAAQGGLTPEQATAAKAIAKVEGAGVGSGTTQSQTPTSNPNLNAVSPENGRAAGAGSAGGMAAGTGSQTGTTGNTAVAPTPAATTATPAPSAESPRPKLTEGFRAELEAAMRGNQVPATAPPTIPREEPQGPTPTEPSAGATGQTPAPPISQPAPPEPTRKRDFWDKIDEADARQKAQWAAQLANTPLGSWSEDMMWGAMRLRNSPDLQRDYGDVWRVLYDRITNEERHKTGREAFTTQAADLPEALQQVAMGRPVPSAAFPQLENKKDNTNDPDRTRIDGGVSPEPANLESPRPAGTGMPEGRPGAAQQSRGAQERTQPATAAGPAVAVAEPAPAPTPAEIRKRIARGMPMRRLFDAETEAGGWDILAFLNAEWRIMSRSAALKRWGKEKFDQNKSMWDDAPVKLERVHHNQIYKPEGLAPDEAAAAAHEAGLIDEPTPSALWAAVIQASRQRAGMAARQRRDEKILREMVESEQAWRAATEEGEVRVDAGDLRPGDLMEVEGERVRVRRITAEGVIELEDGTRFGRQEMRPGETIYVEQISEDLRERIANSYNLRDETQPTATTHPTTGTRTTEPMAAPAAQPEPRDTRLLATALAQLPAEWGSALAAAGIPWDGGNTGGIRGQPLQPAGGRNGRTTGASAPTETARPGLRLTQELRAALEKLFGVLIVPVRSTRNGPVPFNGASIKVTRPGEKPIILLAVDSERPVLAVAGHELMHALRRTAPALYQDLANRMLPLMQNVERYQARLNALRLQRGLNSLSEDKIREEMLADLLGDSLNRPDFWVQLSQEDPNLFVRAARAVYRWLSDVLDQWRGSGYGVQNYFTDLERARDMVGGALRTWTRERSLERWETARMQAQPEPDFALREPPGNPEHWHLTDRELEELAGDLQQKVTATKDWKARADLEDVLLEARTRGLDWANRPQYGAANGQARTTRQQPEPEPSRGDGGTIPGRQPARNAGERTVDRARGANQPARRERSAEETAASALLEARAAARELGRATNRAQYLKTQEPIQVLKRRLAEAKSHAIQLAEKLALERTDAVEAAYKALVRHQSGLVNLAHPATNAWLDAERARNAAVRMLWDAESVSGVVYPDHNYLQPNEGMRQAMAARENQKRETAPGADFSLREEAPGNPWPQDFPKVLAMSTAAAVIAHPQHKAAKAGDVAAAVQVVADLGKPDRALALAQKYPNAIVVAVHAEEASGRNKLPMVFAAWLEEIAGLQTNPNVVQATRAGRTGSDAWTRLAFRPEFDGPVEPGRDYILVDDIVTGGGTLSELRQYIEARGGRVVHTSTLGFAQFSTNLALTENTRLALVEKFGDSALRDFCKEHNLYGGEWAALTESEARTLLRAGSLNAARDRIAAARRSGSSPPSQTTAESTPDGETGVDFSLRDEYFPREEEQPPQPQPAPTPANNPKSGPADPANSPAEQSPEAPESGEPDGRTARQLMDELDAASAAVGEAVRDHVKHGGKERLQRKYEAMARMRLLKEALRKHPDFTRALLRQHARLSKELEALRAAQPIDANRLEDVRQQVVDVEAELAHVNDRLKARVAQEMIDAGELPKAPEMVYGRSLDALTDWLRQQDINSPGITMRERWELLKGRPAAAWNRTKDNLEAARLKLAGWWKTTVDHYMNVPKDTDFRATFKDWMYADAWTAQEVRKFQREIERKVPNPVRQSAISVWLDAGGDEGLIRMQEAGFGPDQEQYARVWRVALNLTDDEKRLALQIKADFAAKLEDAVNAGLLERGRANYGVPQLWKKAPQRKNDQQAAYDARMSAGNPTAKLDPRNPFFALEREYPTLADGIQMGGGKPKDLRIQALVGYYNLAFHKALDSRAMIWALKQAQAEDGSPVVMVSGSAREVKPDERGAGAYLVDSSTRGKAAVTADGRPYMTVDHFALKDWRIAYKTTDGKEILVRGDMLVHPDHAEFLKNELLRSPLREGNAGKVLNPLLQATAFLKASKLAFGTFHLFTIAEHMASHLVNPFVSGFQIDLRDPKQALLVRNGLELGLGTHQMHYEEGLASHGGAFNMIPGAGDLSRRFTDWMFQDYIPRISMKAGLIIYEANLKRYGPASNLPEARKLTRDQVAELTANQMNAAGGLLNYRLMGRNKVIMDFTRLALLAPQFLEARARVVGQALKPYGVEQRKMLFMQAAALYIGCRVLNTLLDGDPHWEPEAALGVVYNGRLYTIRTIVGDAHHAATDPYSFAAGRLSPIGRLFIETLTQRDLRTGARKEPPIQTDWTPSRVTQNIIMDLLNWLVPIGSEGWWFGAAGREQSPWTALGGMIGIGSKKHTASIAMYDLASAWNRANPDPAARRHQLGKDADTKGPGPFRKLDALLRAQEWDQAQTELDALMADGRKLVDIIERYNNVNRPFTGTLTREVQFKRSLTPTQAEMYQAAIEERRALRAAFRMLRQQKAGMPAE